MRLNKKNWIGLFTGLLMMSGTVSAGVLSPVYFSDTVDVADSSDLNSDIASRTDGTLNLKYDTRAVSGAQNGNWSVSGGQLKFVGTGSNAQDLYLVNGGNGAYQNLNPELAGTFYRISATLVTSSSSGDPTDSIGISLHDNINGTEALLVRQIRSRSQIQVLENGTQTGYDQWANNATNRIDITVDERTIPFSYDVQVNGAVIQTGTVSFADSDRFVFFNLTDTDGDMIAHIDNISVGQYLEDPWSGDDEVLFNDTVLVGANADLNADIENRTYGTLALEYDTKSVSGAQNANWEVVDGQLEFTGTSGSAANLYLVSRSNGAYQNFNALIGTKYWIAASLNTLATDGVDSIGISLHESIAGVEVLAVKKIKVGSQLDVVPGGVTTRHANLAVAEKYYVVMEVDETVNPATYAVMVNGAPVQSGTLSFTSTTQRRIYFRMYDHNSDGDLNATLDDVSIVQAATEVPDPFDVPQAPNLIVNGDFSQVESQTGDIPSNLIGSYGDFLAFENRTLEVTGWQPFHNDPSNLISKIGIEHLVTGDSGDLNGTFYLDTLYNNQSGNQMVFNSSMSYRNGVVQSNILNGVYINPALNYSYYVDVAHNAGTNPTNSDFTAALTIGADLTNTSSAVANSLIQAAATALPTDNGTLLTAQVSGADLLAAQSSGGINALFELLNTTAIPNYPTVAPEDVANVDLVSQVKIAGIGLKIIGEAGDINQNGILDRSDADLAQYYLDGAGGDPATVRQDALIQQGSTTNEALDYLNLTDFDMNGDGYFDAADVAAIDAVTPDFTLQINPTGTTTDFTWFSLPGKIYDLESTDSLTPASWAAYDDGVTVYTNIPASGSGVTGLPGVPDDGTARFYKMIEKD